jgi:hypothetical protein
MGEVVRVVTTGARLTNRNQQVREALERWAKWRHYRHGGYGKTLTERLIEGMPGTHCPTCGGRGKRGPFACPTCEGAGRVRLEDKPPRAIMTPCQHCERGERNGRTCSHCRGSGIRVYIEAKVNPAHIRSTYRVPDDPVCQRIDRLVCELRRRDELLGYWFVLHAEYMTNVCLGRTQAEKAQRMLLTQKCYESRLYRAVEWIGHGLKDQRPADVIPFPYRVA